ncbi:MAG: PhoH family protein [Acidobacteriota bacterium]|nr:MAG: PhoH family protein [Acidobacteriota bacterium]
MRAGSAGPSVAFPQESFRTVIGEYDANLRLIEKTFGVRLLARDGQISIFGEPTPVQRCVRFLDELAELLREGLRLQSRDIAHACRLYRMSPETPLADQLANDVVGGVGQRRVLPRTPRQADYLRAIDENDIVFAIGPAGTGKTYLAVAKAIESLSQRRVRRIVLCRPAVEAGERLGFLPGDLAQKVDPYLRPLYDALYDIWEGERASRMIEQNTVEVAPLAFMRGRTLNDSFIILDEAQNTTPEQMKMFLTRIGEGSKAIVTGDITQIDLPAGRQSGLIQVRQVVMDIEGIEFVTFDKQDVVRHELVRRIVRAYEVHDAAERGKETRAESAAGEDP